MIFTWTFIVSSFVVELGRNLGGTCALLGRSYSFLSVVSQYSVLYFQHNEWDSCHVEHRYHVLLSFLIHQIVWIDFGYLPGHLLGHLSCHLLKKSVYSYNLNSLRAFISSIVVKKYIAEIIRNTLICWRQTILFYWHCKEYSPTAFLHKNKRIG